MKKKIQKKRKRGFYIFLTGFLTATLLIFSGNKAIKLTNTDSFCASCHEVHPHATTSWKQSTHYDNQGGVVVHCIECHLPPEGLYKISEKAKTGIRDVYGALFKDVHAINWEEKSMVSHAVGHTYKSSCLSCHENLFPLGLSREGEDAHLYYHDHSEELHCINCHIGVGHYSEHSLHAQNMSFGQEEEKPDTLYSTPGVPEGFTNFTEQIPGTGISFNMIAVKGGSFILGSPEDEAFRDSDEGPQVETDISDFFICETEVSWDQYLTFFSETGSEGRVSEGDNTSTGVDGISGPTPPWGDPGQGWGRGERPAITMSHQAAGVFCQWLSRKTGKTYRLPTEAEWEYAARGGTTGSYFFEGKPKDYTSETFFKKIFGADTSLINSYAVYRENSQGRTQLPGRVLANPLGIKHMLGNVAEFCSDYYSPTIYSTYKKGEKDPQGPVSGKEFVIRGGSFKADASGLRTGNREHTETTSWLKTDPQMPKSIWWYSDAVHIGFRVVCEQE